MRAKIRIINKETPALAAVAWQPVVLSLPVAKDFAYQAAIRIGHVPAMIGWKREGATFLRDTTLGHMELTIHDKAPQLDRDGDNPLTEDQLRSRGFI